MDTVWLVIPCYNEEEVIEETASRLKGLMHELMQQDIIAWDSKIAFVNDGSKDNTWSIIQKLYQEDKIFAGITLSRNRGHQNALLAGLMTGKTYADAVITMDADLQDDIGAIRQFIEKYKEGYDIVYGVRSSRKKDTFFKKHSAQAFYKIMKFLGCDIIYNHADYRLMSKRTLDELEKYKEVNLFLRGIVPQIGFETTTVEYERNERYAGESKYPLGKMLSFAWEGITSFSVKPVRLIAIMGIMIFTMSFVMLCYFISRYFTGNTVSGWASIIVSVWALGGLQLFAIGIIGEYIGKTYLEAKNRPKYTIAETLIDRDLKGK